MIAFSPPLHLSVLFTLLTLLVVGIDVYLVSRAAPPNRRASWLYRAALAASLWIAGHAALAYSGVLEGNRLPPPMLPYLLVTFGLGVWVILSPLGRQLSLLPLGVLVAVQSFRLPLEIILHELYRADALPVQMTWQGLNFDVLTGITAAALAVYSRYRPLPRAWVWAWNLMGSALLLTVVTIALLSAPLPLRMFHNEPAVVLPFYVPYNWIVNVHVWTALVGHGVIFRALLSTRRAAS